MSSLLKIDIKNFIRLQGVLWDTYVDHFDVRDSNPLYLPSRRGELSVEGDTWLYSRHGNGVLFTNKSSRAQIDIPEALTCAQVVDSWILGMYFGSIGKAGEKFLFKEIGTRAGSVQDRAELWIQKLVRENVLVPSRAVKHGYELNLS